MMDGGGYSPPQEQAIFSVQFLVGFQLSSDYRAFLFLTPGDHALDDEYNHYGILAIYKEQATDIEFGTLKKNVDHSMS